MCSLVRRLDIESKHGKSIKVGVGAAEIPIRVRGTSMCGELKLNAEAEVHPIRMATALARKIVMV